MSAAVTAPDDARTSFAPAIAPLAALALVAAVVASAANHRTVWYVIRGAGILAYAMFTLSVIVGLLMSSRALPSGRPRVDLFEIHGFTSLLGLALVSVHITALLLDNFVTFSPTQVLLPFTSTYRPFGVSLGIVAMYVMAVVYASFWARRYIGRRTWRTLHYASFVGFVLAALHGSLSGADSHAGWMVAIYGVSVGAVVALAARRVAFRTGTPRGEPP